MLQLLCFASVALLPRATAFGVPPHLAAGAARSLVAAPFVAPSLWLSDEGAASVVEQAAAQATRAVVETSIAVETAGAGGGILGTLKDAALAITAVLFFGAGLAYLLASVIVPAAAKELEQECKELAPELWDQYAAKLLEGETMANRPDLMQELGVKLQPLIDAKVERQFAEQKEKGIDVGQEEAAWKAFDSLKDKTPSAPASAASAEPSIEVSISNRWDDAGVSKDVVVDAEIIKTDK